MRSKRFKPVVEHAQHLEKEAARALGEASQRLQEAEQQLAQLQDYCQEYNERYKQVGQVNAGPRRLLDYQAFMAKLNDALVQQTGAVSSAIASLEEVKQFWLTKRGRSKALDSVLSGYIDDELRAEEKKEQRETDDLRRPKVQLS